MIIAAVLLAVPALLWWACLGFFLQRWWLLAACWGVPVGATAVLVAAVAVLTGLAGHPRMITPEAATRKVVPQLPEPGPLDFAWPAYFFEQWWYDVAEIIRLSKWGTALNWGMAWRLVPRWPNLVRRIGADDLDAPRTRWTTIALIGPLLAVPAAFLAGATAGAVAALVLVTAVAAALWAIVFLGCAAGVGVVVGWTRATRRVYRAQAYCTRCFHRAELPAYACPGRHRDAPDAEHLHRRLRPGILGVWWHRCGCGLLLPTTPRRVSRALEPFCPACQAPLHTGAGYSRDVRIAVFGGPYAGKSSLVTGAIGVFTAAPAAPAAVDPLPAGAAPASPAVTLRFAGGRRPALVHLFDSRGEDLLDPERRRRLTYLEDAGSLILTLDPFSIPAVRTALDQVPEDRRPAAGPTGDEPDDAYRAMVEALRFHGAGAAPRRLAVVVTKYDALAVLPRERMDPGSDAVREWLSRHGLGRVVFAAARDFPSVRYFRTSTGEPDGIGEPLGWLLREEGVKP